MITSTENEIRVLIPDNGKWLYNANVKTISDKVYLGIKADASEWVEITEDEKQRLEAEWEAEIDNPDEATEEDYLNALERLGVKE